MQKTGKESLLKQISPLTKWLQDKTAHSHTRSIENKPGSGFIAVFTGSHKDDKRSAANLLARQFNTNVFRVDTAEVLSKYIGEAEENLSNIFNKAEQKEWILFFDEADALFGRRTDVKDAHDKYANQEISYLLKKIEDYRGLVILATNKNNKTDNTFLQRINSTIEFIKDEQKANDNNNDDK